ncbi:MAG TPA: hypothetical protein VLL52_10230 [Anaerolineae bacterium]|nr:hypothetical protein [Anaerolineae bacterium]
MGDYKLLLGHCADYEWPAEMSLTETAKSMFARGIDLVDGYRGWMEPLFEAVMLFRDCGSRPYAFAGMAYALVAASYIDGDAYELEGIEQGQAWLDEALLMVSETGAVGEAPEIGFVQLWLDRAKGDIEALLAHVVRLEPANEAHFHTQLGKLHYRCRAQRFNLAQAQYEKVLALSETRNQEMLAHQCMVALFIAIMALATREERLKKVDLAAMRQKYGERGRVVFAAMAPHSQRDPWFWHNYSLFCYYMKQYMRSARYNKEALALLEFGAAKELRERLSYRVGLLYALVGLVPLGWWGRMDVLVRG